tara:strand:+ start:840 stop:1550 length:711 start_codon:yes stop_codon:yes gene_type:complete
MLIKDIKNKEVRELAVERGVGLMVLDRDKVLKTELGGAFCWAHTPEGDDFWRTLNNDQDSQEAEVLIQDVLKPTKTTEDKYTGNRVPLDHVDTTGVLNTNFIKSPFDYLQFRRSSETTGNVGLYKEPTDKLAVIDGEIKAVSLGTTSQDDLIRLSKELQKVKNHRSYNVGKSDYAEHNIQPWDIWKEYKLDPWDADIVKRILRKKEGESRIMDYEKIKHICDEKIAQEKEKEQLNK